VEGVREERGEEEGEGGNTAIKQLLVELYT